MNTDEKLETLLTEQIFMWKVVAFNLLLSGCALALAVVAVGR